jgi:Protein of unknown function (DUF2516)
MAVVNLVNLVLSLVTLAIKICAFGDACFRSSAAFAAVGKLPKIFWVLVLGIAAAAQIGYAGISSWTTSWLTPLGLVGIIAALVYLFGIRPEVIKYSGPRRGKRSTEGPYGPW